METALLREGLRAVRIGQLASEARCSRSTLYELAPSKEELFLVVLDRMMRRISRQGADAINRHRDPAARIKAMLSSGALSVAPLGTTFMEAVQQYPPARLLFDHHIAAGRNVLEGLIADAIGAGEFQSVHAGVVAEALFAVVIRFTDPEFVHAAGISSSVALSEFFDVLITGLGAAS